MFSVFEKPLSLLTVLMLRDYFRLAKKVGDWEESLPFNQTLAL